MLHSYILNSLEGQFSKTQPKKHNFKYFLQWRPINGSGVTPFKAKNDAAENMS